MITKRMIITSPYSFGKPEVTWAISGFRSKRSFSENTTPENLILIHQQHIFISALSIHVYLRSVGETDPFRMEGQYPFPVFFKLRILSIGFQILEGLKIASQAVAIIQY